MRSLALCRLQTGEGDRWMDQLYFKCEFDFQYNARFPSLLQWHSIRPDYAIRCCSFNDNVAVNAGKYPATHSNQPSTPAYTDDSLIIIPINPIIMISVISLCEASARFYWILDENRIFEFDIFPDVRLLLPWKWNNLYGDTNIYCSLVSGIRPSIPSAFV